MKTNCPTLVALYLRVSTTDKGQETNNQLLQLREFCNCWGWQIHDLYINQKLRRKGKRGWGNFSPLFDHAAGWKFDVVLFWSIDRFTYEGCRKTIAYLQQLDSFGVRFKSYNEPLLDTGNELVAYIVIGVFSYFTHQGAARIPERMKVDLQRVRSQGKTLGRPDGFKRWKDKSASMRAVGYLQGQIQQEIGLAYNTVKSYLRCIEKM